MAMWKQDPSFAPAGSLPDQVRPSAPVAQLAPVTPFPPASLKAAYPGAEQSVLTSGMIVRGEITCTEALYIDGIVEGEIKTLGERVTVGPNGKVVATSKAPCITAREIVVLGTVIGDIVATDRLEIRANGNVTGDVTTVRLRIEDGSVFQGGIDIRKPEPKLVQEIDQTQFSPSDLEYAAASV